MTHKALSLVEMDDTDLPILGAITERQDGRLTFRYGSKTPGKAQWVDRRKLKEELHELNASDEQM